LVWFSNDVLPNANQRARSLFIDIRLKKPGFDLKENQFYNGIDNYTFLVKQITDQSDSLHNIMIYQHPTTKREEAYIKAQKGRLESEQAGQTLTLRLKSGSIIRYLKRRKNHRNVDVVEETAFNRYRISFDLSDLAFSKSNPQNRSRNDRTMNIQAMQAVVDSLRNQVQHQKQIVVKNTGYITPFYEKKRSHRNRALQAGKDSLKDKPYHSRFVTLQYLNSKNKQENLHQMALSSLRSYKSFLGDIDTDTHWRISKIHQYLVEIHKKFSIPIACMIFVMLGAPIGMYTKKGNLGYAALIGTVFLTFYWVSIIQGEKLADRLIISPFTGMWFSDILLGLVGIFLMVKTCTSFKFSNLWKKRD